MANRGKPARAAPRASAGRPTSRVLEPEDQELNDKIIALMRDAAEQLEIRTRSEAAEDTAAARRQFDAIVALTRARSLQPRS